MSVGFWDRVSKNGPLMPGMLTRCWVWTGARNKANYGQFKFVGRQVGAHRLSWFISYGRWPTPCCLHRCDNPACVRPTHLFEGTHQDNMDDKVAKGRQATGDKIPFHRNPELTSGER